ncbi:MAG TPA: hypothetical protein VGR28_13040 [Candidatus Thermoplasmatota archaeon]|jgi:uncharacterized coiled-coil DUF342 family protein|nr:hypothetical protein [Candidatus Thermoplasmatota archaeon]
MGVNKERAAKSREKLNSKGSDEDVEAKSLKDKRQDAEQRFRKILDRRNALNDESRQARDARDGIQAERRRIYDEANALMTQRNDVAAKIKVHKQVRGESQGRAKQLIGLKQEKRKGGQAGLGVKVRDLEAAIKALEFKQQTVPMSGPKELELLDEIKDKVKELEEARKVKAGQDLIFGEIKDIDAAINEAFAKADAEHAQVVALSQEWQALTEKLGPTLQQMDYLKGEADKRHADAMELRKRADDEHQKAMAMRGEVDATREEIDKLYQERRAVIQEIRQQVQALDDPAAAEASADEALQLLREKGRISLT